MEIESDPLRWVKTPNVLWELESSTSCFGKMKRDSEEDAIMAIPLYSASLLLGEKYATNTETFALKKRYSL